MSEPRFRVSPEIVHETVDGEVIAIDLANGSYYSLAGSGPVIWAVLGAGAGEAEIAAALGRPVRCRRRDNRRRRLGIAGRAAREPA